MSKFTDEFIAEQRAIAASTTLDRSWNFRTNGTWEWFDGNDARYATAAANNYPVALDEIAALRLALDAANQHARACEQKALDAMAEVERMREAQRWIPVEDSGRQDDSYLCLVTDGILVTVGYCDHFGAWWSADDLRLPFDVTHWMPLPEPPRQEANKD